MIEFVDSVGYMLFATKIIADFRYVRDHWSEKFLQAIVSTAAKRETIIKKGEIVWRAQLGMSKGQDERAEIDEALRNKRPLSRERMKPLPEAATEGRANPKGIPALYVATDPDTAMSEVRPNLASSISLAELEVCHDLKIVDCTMKMRSERLDAFVALPTMEERELFLKQSPASQDDLAYTIWGDIDDAFTQPVNLSDNIADYTPTQIIAEYIKAAGYDGIQYKSGYETCGHNLVLFDLDSAEVRNVKLMGVSCINMTFCELT